MAGESRRRDRQSLANPLRLTTRWNSRLRRCTKLSLSSSRGRRHCCAVLRRSRPHQSGNQCRLPLRLRPERPRYLELKGYLLRVAGLLVHKARDRRPKPARRDSCVDPTMDQAGVSIGMLCAWHGPSKLFDACRLQNCSWWRGRARMFHHLNCTQSHPKSRRLIFGCCWIGL